MNDLVKDLLKQSTYEILGVPQVDQKKFAELIVRECIDYCGENLSKTVGGALQIHFGFKLTKREKFDQAMQAAFANGIDLSGKETP